MRFLVPLLIFLISISQQIISGKEKDTIILINKTKVEIRFPSSKIIGTVLVLPGWNFSQDDICKKSSFCEEASRRGFVLIMPDMQKSIYHSRIYNETRKDWLKYHTLKWLTDTVIPYLQSDFKLLLVGDKNFVFGISTGGRGVAQLAYNTQGIFIGGASLSGDFNQTKNQVDNLMRGYYGDYELFTDRWESTDNPFKDASRITIPLYLGHGKADKVVDYSQTESFYNILKTSNAKLLHVLHIEEGAEHDYNYWQSEYGNVFDFFEKHR